jgi:endogenous inhibitor of DNA gyrase (YacG/DUF329 family)
MSDLGKWATDEYRIEGESADIEDDEKKLKDS